MPLNIHCWYKKDLPRGAFDSKLASFDRFWLPWLEMNTNEAMIRNLFYSFIIIYLCIYFWLRVFTAVWAFSRGKHGLLSGCGVWASNCSRFSFFSFIFISWRLITSQHCSGFCHKLTWISHGVTCIPHPDPPSHLPIHPIPLGLPSAQGPSTCLMHPTWAGDLFHYR